MGGGVTEGERSQRGGEVTDGERSQRGVAGVGGHGGVTEWGGGVTEGGSQRGSGHKRGVTEGEKSQWGEVPKGQRGVTEGGTTNN